MKISRYKKIYCTSCGKKMDATAPACPSCRNANQFFDPRYKNDLHIGSIGNLVFFLTGLIGLQVLGTIIALLVQTIFYSGHTEAELDAFIYTSQYSLLVNGIDYLILITVLFLLLIFAFKGTREYFSAYKGLAIVWGIVGLAGLYALSVAWSLIASLIQNAIVASTGLDFNMSVNANQSTINSILIDFPVLSFIVFGVMGPVCEELTYRAGLFSLLKRKNRVFAYLLTGIIFGFIHFDFSCLMQTGTQTYNDYMVNMINEFLNLPDYILAGLFLSFIYDWKGIGASTFSHMLYNCVALTINIISMKSGQN